MGDYQIRRDGPVWVLELQGDVDAAVAPALRQQLRELVAGGAPRLVLDFGRVPFADASAVHALAYAAEAQADRQGSLEICGCNPAVLRLFRLSGLDALIRSDSQAQ